MANSNPENIEDPNQETPPVETNYEAHADNPGPAPTVNEPDNKGAGQALKWSIPIIFLILLVIYIVFFRNSTINWR
jgi:hypothetical protein